MTKTYEVIRKQTPENAGSTMYHRYSFQTGAYTPYATWEHSGRQDDQGNAIYIVEVNDRSVTAFETTADGDESIVTYREAPALVAVAPIAKPLVTRMAEAILSVPDFDSEGVVRCVFCTGKINTTSYAVYHSIVHNRDCIKRETARTIYGLLPLYTQELAALPTSHLTDGDVGRRAFSLGIIIDGLERFMQDDATDPDCL